MRSQKQVSVVCSLFALLQSYWNFPVLALDAWNDPVSGDQRMAKLKWGYMDQFGNLAIKPLYDKANGFSDGLACVSLGKKWGFIDRTGKLTIAPQYDGPGVFSNGRAVVQKNKGAGIIDRSGKWICAPKSNWTKAGDFSEGLASIDISGKIGFVDRDGTVIIPPRFDSESSPIYQPTFKEGAAMVSLNHRPGRVDKTGAFTLATCTSETANLNASEPSALRFSEGLAPKANESGLVGFVDKSGGYAIKPKWFDTGNFHDGLAWVKDFKNKYGLINSAGEQIVSPQFDFGIEFWAGSLAPVCKDGLWALIDKNGSMVTPLRFRGFCETFDSEGLLAVAISTPSGEAYWRAIPLEINSNYLSALRLYNISIKLDPRFAMAYLHRSRVYDALGQPRAALADLDNALKLDPKLSIACADRAFIFEKLNLKESMRKDIAKALALSPNLSVTYLIWAYTYASGATHDYNKSITQCTRAIRLNPKSKDAYLKRMELYFQIGDYRMAISDCNKGLEFERKSSYVYLIRGACYQELGELHKAVEDYTTSVMLNPTALAYRRRARLYDAFADHQKAETDYRMAESIDRQ